MTEWAVTVTWDAAVPVTVDELEQLADAGASVAGEPGRQRVEMTLTISAQTPGKAVATALTLALLHVPGDVAGVDVLTTAEQDRRLALPAFPELAGVSEVAQLLGVSRQRASALQTSAGFPGPVATLASGPVWRLTDLSRFAGTWQRKPGRPSREARFAAETAAVATIDANVPNFIRDPKGHHAAQLERMAHDDERTRLAFTDTEDDG